MKRYDKSIDLVETRIIGEGVGFVWESYKLDPYVLCWSFRRIFVPM